MDSRRRSMGMRIHQEHDFQADKEDLLYNYNEDMQKHNKKIFSIQNNTELSEAEKAEQINKENQYMSWVYSEYQKEYSEIEAAQREYAEQHGLNYASSNDAYSYTDAQTNQSSYYQTDNQTNSNIYLSNIPSSNYSQSTSNEGQYSSSQSSDNSHSNEEGQGY